MKHRYLLAIALAITTMAQAETGIHS